MAGLESLTIDTTTDNTDGSGGRQVDGSVVLADIGTTVRLSEVSVTAGDGTIWLNDGADANSTADRFPQTLCRRRMPLMSYSGKKFNLQKGWPRNSICIPV